jgi:thioredoxin 2
MGVIRECKACGQKNRVPGKFLASPGKCGKCKADLPAVAEPLAVDEAMFDDVVQNAADMAGKAVVLKVDTEANPGLSARFQIRGIPNFVVMAGGKVVMQQAGVVGHEVMEEWLRSSGVRV